MYVIILILTVAFALYKYLGRTHDYWQKRGVPYFPATPLFGNLWKLMSVKQSPGEFLGELHQHPTAQGQRYVGMFLWNSEPALLIRDPELIKHIFVKDFAHFQNRNIECDPINDPVGYHNLFVIKDEKWKALRTKLSPAFTSGRMKLMFKLITDVAEQLMINIDAQIDKSSDRTAEIATKELMARYTTDVISTTAFGIQANSLNDPKAIFREFGKKVFEFNFKRSLEIRSFFFMHGLSKMLRAIFFNRESSQFFRDVFWDAMKVRERENIKRNDFMDILIELQKDGRKKKENGKNEEVLDFEGDFLVAQTVLFFVAGFETTSSTICNALLELANAPEIQEKLRKEITTSLAGNNGVVTYDHLFGMKYLDQVVSETLRKYPAMPIIDRCCTMDYKIPDSDLVIKKGTPVFVGLYDGLHYDPDYFPDPKKFDPDRFTEENKASRHTFSYIPFGEGPHICIGMRFGLMSVKTSLVKVLSKYRVEPTADSKVPPPIDHTTFLIAVDGPMNLRFTPV